MAVVCQCIFQLIAYHHILVNAVFVFVICQEIICHLESMASVIIVCIDHGERSVYFSETVQHRMSGSPWFHTSFGHLIAFRQTVKILEHIFHFDPAAQTVADGSFEICFVFFFNDKHDFSKSGSYSIVNGKIHDNMSIFVNRIDLL